MLPCRDFFAASFIAQRHRRRNEKTLRSIPESQKPRAKKKKIEISLLPFGKNNPAESERVGVGGGEKCMQCNSPVQVLHASDVSPASE
jgi:hypothetical protein